MLAGIPVYLVWQWIGDRKGLVDRQQVNLSVLNDDRKLELADRLPPA